MYKTIEDFIGNTPLARLQRLPRLLGIPASTVVLAKCTPKERQDLLAMLNAVANIEGRPNALITQELAGLADDYKRAAATR